MSQTGRSTQNAAGDEHWEQVLVQLRADGFSPIESIKVTRAVRHVSLSEAKRIVHCSQAWTDARQGFDELHDDVESAVSHL
jgi:ribosomal protein L7/L12